MSASSPKHRIATLLPALALALATALAAPTPDADGSEPQCPMVRIDAERLPDLHLPRAGHCVFCADGEVTVVGGHTDGFVPTPTAEYFSNGKWHLVPTVYSHDDGSSVLTKSGRVLVAGGHSEPLGIGQTFTVEWYDPQRHTFSGFSCMDTKRSLLSMAEIGGGQVVIAGNHYHDDVIELFDGQRRFAFVKKGSAPRTRPLIFRIADDDALIMGCLDNRSQRYRSTRADRLRGEPVYMPLLEHYYPFQFLDDVSTAEALIGDEAAHDYRYLLAVCDSADRVSVALLTDTVLQLLPAIVPMRTPWGRIFWFGPGFVTDRRAHRAYFLGGGNANRLYVLSLNLDSLTSPHASTLYYTDPLPAPANYKPVLTPDGDLVVAGGYSYILNDSVFSDNFTPYASAYRLRLSALSDAASARTGVLGRAWPKLAVALLIALLAAFAAFMVFRARRRHARALASEAVPDTSSAATASSAAADPPSAASTPNTELYDRICQLITTQQLFLRSGLKVSDLAVMLGTNSSYVSDCINACSGTSFSQFVNAYRVEYAKMLLGRRPDLKLSAVATESGFSSESSFFRTFKQHTGSTPKEWIATPASARQ